MQLIKLQVCSVVPHISIESLIRKGDLRMTKSNDDDIL